MVSRRRSVAYAMSPVMTSKLEQRKEIIKEPEPSVREEDDFFEA